MYKLEKILSCIYSNLILLLKKATNYNNFHYSFPIICDSPPKIKIKEGKVFLGRISARSGLSIFCENGKIEISDGCFFNNYCSINCQSKITIGKNTLFGEGVKVYDHNHTFDVRTGVSHSDFVTDPIRIGDNCWIGSNCIILKGVNICNNVLVGAGAIVTKNIERPGIYIYKDGNLNEIR
ncbi:MAG: hypothetical protein COA41_12290 [Sphingopyxis sp.]|nr:MAG: hypothetical protein COA41_12290 [Sphingopyxis sp.]